MKAIKLLTILNRINLEYNLKFKELKSKISDLNLKLNHLHHQKTHLYKNNTRLVVKKLKKNNRVDFCEFISTSILKCKKLISKKFNSNLDRLCFKSNFIYLFYSGLISLFIIILNLNV